MMDRPVLLMTRPRAASERFLAELAGDGISGFTTIISPLFDIQPAEQLPDLSGIKGLIFTSAHGVTSYCDLGGSPALPCFAVGPATAETARKHGFDVTSSSGNVEDLRDLIVSHAPSGPLMHLHGAHVTGDLKRILSTKGIPTQSAVIYDQPERPLNNAAVDALNSRLPVIIPLFSPRSGRLLTCTEWKGTSLLVAAMSDVVAEAISGGGIHSLCVSQAPNSASLRNCVAQLLQKACSLLDEQDPQGL